MTPQVISLSSAGSTAWIPVDYKQNPFYINLALVLSDTPSLTCKVEYTLDNVFDSSITPTAFTHTGLSSVSTNTTGSITYPIRAFRLTVTAWTSGTVTLTALQGVTNPQIYTTTGSGSLIYKFPDWPVNVGLLLSSLVASSTASRTANVVTIIASAHSMPLSTPYAGFRFYYPGSPSLAAGWYSNASIVNSFTITFSAEGADFASESINGGVAWNTATDMISINIPANTLRDQSKVNVCLFRDSYISAGVKTLALVLGGTVISSYAVSTTPKGETVMSFRCTGTTKQVGPGNGVENILSGTTSLYATRDITADQTLTIRGTISTPAEHIAIYGAYVEITQ